MKIDGAELGEEKPVSERPGGKPFAREIDYRVGDLFWGKIHIRNSGKMYMLVTSKIPFNWKPLVKDLKLKGKVVDSAGGFLWVQEDEKYINDDVKFLKDYLEKMKNSKKE
ncbi:hypothetical protein [Picrophilus oshimae]|uniref:Succinate dehydrogenase, subunit D n=1 Tax=Picrophilus torridus (strain ATCC 700027 / DSM 9790 / JCM 10055 / NBRC 100828 / KAW 2/3) TaxID=1122961 RepID=Q6L0B9_PICTO|nr:hypothetical protein [Picrophilus oshimae]AAT43583.1 succinate dehydrogenase, subunit D [Picrophilus oshimae DSM 9789]